MISGDIIKNQIKFNLDKTEFNIGKKIDGKVRDNYLLGDKRVIVTTDRISAFDRVLCTIPFKGQVLNQTSAFWFENTKHIVKNHIIDIPDPNVTIGKECKLIPVEMVVRGYLTGVTKTSAWYNYQKGVRDFCGNKLPEGLKKDQKFAMPIITPSTKAEKGLHDESISGEEVVKRGLVNQEIYDKMAKAAIELYKFGNELVSRNNLILVDTKYEFGLDPDGNLTLIDEIHTPDSSRYWIKNSYEERFSMGQDPQKLDKEYVRQWLAEMGFLGDGEIPLIPDDVKIEAAQRYITAYEMITGQKFNAVVGDILTRITNNLESKGILTK
jgi:phosphoribosylaminoimidazole-succinocarboxamide synthase